MRGNQIHFKIMRKQFKIRICVFAIANPVVCVLLFFSPQIHWLIYTMMNIKLNHIDFKKKSSELAAKLNQ
jgi:hypothetical protein